MKNLRVLLEDNKNLGISFLEINEISLEVANHIGKVSEDNSEKGELLKTSILDLFQRIVSLPGISKKIVRKKFSLDFINTLRGKSESFLEEYEKKLSVASSKQSIDGKEAVRKKLKKNDGSPEEAGQEESDTLEKIKKKENKLIEKQHKKHQITKRQENTFTSVENNFSMEKNNEILTVFLNN